MLIHILLKFSQSISYLENRIKINKRLIKPEKEDEIDNDGYYDLVKVIEDYMKIKRINKVFFKLKLRKFRDINFT